MSPDQAAGTVAERHPAPSRSRLATWHVVLPVSVVVGVTTLVWVSNGGLGAVVGGGRSSWLAVGRIAGLWMGLLAWGGVILSARPRVIELRYGLDGLLRAHRWVGMATVATLVVHIGAVVVAGRAGSQFSASSLFDGAVALLDEPWMVAAWTAAALFVMVGVTSWHRLRIRMPYESWYFLHLTAYVGLLLGIGHQFTMGSDIAGDQMFRAWWIAVTVAAAVIVGYSRLRDVARTLRRGPLPVVRVDQVTPDSIAFIVEGSGVGGTEPVAGQFFRVRVLARGLWWQTHPMSLSAVATPAGIRFTIKDLGDGTHELMRVQPGARVLLSGPYGVFTAERAQGRPVLLIGGGVGLAPLRGILADCSPEQTPVVIARARTSADVPHAAEIRHIARARGGSYLEVLGPTSSLGEDPFDRPLRTAVPDLAGRDVFVCGSNRLVAAAVRGLRRHQVPAEHIHTERFPS